MKTERIRKANDNKVEKVHTQSVTKRTQSPLPDSKCSIRSHSILSYIMRTLTTLQQHTATTRKNRHIPYESAQNTYNGGCFRKRLQRTIGRIYIYIYFFKYIFSKGTYTKGETTLCAEDTRVCNRTRDSTFEFCDNKYVQRIFGHVGKKFWTCSVKFPLSQWLNDFGVASVSRIDKIISVFCKRAL